MAKYLRRRKHSLAAFLCCIFVCVRISMESNVDQSQHKSNDFDVSIKTINGKININWNTSSLWQDTTVYFLSSLHDDVTNTSYAVNISVCRAFVQNNDSWKIEPINGNLLEFCNRSRKCGPVQVDDVLVKASRTRELSCQLFTTCANFEGVFRIHVLSVGGGKKYSFQSGNMTILSENFPPFYEVRPSDNDRELLENTPITIKISYFSPSQLCGFGVNPTDNLQFVFKHYKVNDSKCFFMGEKTVLYTGTTTEVKFNDIVIRKADVLYFDYVVKSLASNKTTSSQRLKFITEQTTAVECNMIGGVIYISWRPQWNCYTKNIVERAEFCFYDNLCLRVCEASFFSNGTFRAAHTYEDEIIKKCRKRKDCKNSSYRGDIKFITVSWSPHTQRITCVLFRTCMDYINSFSVKAYSLNDGSAKILNDINVCHKNTQLQHSNQPAVPHSIRVTDVQAHKVTITWKSPRCEIDYLQCDVYVNFSGQETKASVLVKSDGLNYIYTFTKKNLQPYQEVTFWLHTKCDFNNKGEMSPLERVTTKPSAPMFGPYLNNIQSRNQAEIQLTWEYGDVKYLNGVPNETRIVGIVNKTVVYQKTIYGVRITSAPLTVNKTQKCAYYQVKSCNAPHLCSNYSNRLRLPTCVQDETTVPPLDVHDSTSSDNVRIIIASFVTVVIVVIVLLIIYICWKKNKKKMRPKLPALAAEKDKTGDYIPMGQLSHPGEYDSLDKEEYLEQLVT